MQHSPTSVRVRYLDAARAIMLLLGIPFHISEIYRVSGGFFISSPDHSYLASLLNGLIHSFRMPAFFLLSGYFAGMLMERQGPRRWLRGRFIRLGVPLVLTTFSLGVLEQALANYFAGGMAWPDAMQSSLVHPMGWIFHRWFLLVLLMFCTTLVVVEPLRPRVTELWMRLAESPRAVRWATVAFWVFLLLMPFGAIALAKVAGDLTHSTQLKGDALHYGKNVTYFFAGYIIFIVPDGLRRFTTIGRGWIVCSFAALAVYLASYFAFYPEGEELPLWIEVIGIAAEGVTGFLLARLFFSWMRTVLDRESRVVTYLVDGSFCIYLVHALFFIVFGGLFLRISLNPNAEMAIINVLTVIGCLAVYEIARRVPILAWPLNGGPFKLAAGWAKPKGKPEAKPKSPVVQES